MPSHVKYRILEYDEATVPFGGVGASGTGSRLGGAEWNMEAFTETQWVTVRGQIAPYQL